MRIAIVSTTLTVPWGGSEELWARAASRALDEGHEVAAFVARWPMVPDAVGELERRGARIHRRDRHYGIHVEKRLHDLLDSRLGGVSGRLRLISSLAPLFRFRPDVVCVSHGGMYEGMYYPMLRRWLSATETPYVVVSQANRKARVDEGVRAVTREYFEGAYRVAFVSADDRQTAERQLAVSLANGVVVRNPVNLSKTSPVEWPACDPVRLASVARLDVADKGQDLLLEALGDGSWSARPWRLRLYGEGGDGAYLGELARHFGIGDRVELRGQVADVRSIWADNHVLVLPSRSEGTPLALVEAMLCGRPALATAVGGNPDWVTEGESGFIADAANPAAVGAALERAWESRDRWRAMGGAAREAALLRYDPDPGGSLLALLEAASPSSGSSGGAVPTEGAGSP